jgi:HAD superfamily hydrolase (TIGR01450 family)
MTLRGAIVDLDGTVYRGDSLLPDVPEAIDRLRGAGLDLLFFSNNPTKDEAAYVDRLREFGLSVRPGEACSAGVVTTEYLREHHADEAVMLVGAPGLREQLRAAGVALTDAPAETDVLVGSWTPAFDYDDMTAALHAVDADTAFLGTDPDRTFPDENGRVVPGSGAVVESLAATVGRRPDVVLGKPSAVARAAALDRLGVPAEECLVVGDRLDTDIALGARAGMTTVLVLSGIADRADVARSDIDPDYVLDGLDRIGQVLGRT